MEDATFAKISLVSVVNLEYKARQLVPLDLALFHIREALIDSLCRKAAFGFLRSASNLAVSLCSAFIWRLLLGHRFRYLLDSYLPAGREHATIQQLRLRGLSKQRLRLQQADGLLLNGWFVLHVLYKNLFLRLLTVLFFFDVFEKFIFCERIKTSHRLGKIFALLNLLYQKGFYLLNFLYF